MAYSEAQAFLQLVCQAVPTVKGPGPVLMSYLGSSEHRLALSGEL